ncbi:hypothetical protein E2C01_090094 [Portunus trituberculatus]|uniref:Uncharacterized protein n=1 Tax=Portunus trituberculatus TaxID=210409 RepID=A0A5B7JRB0_PORTR|nr:hypothetical protein [Portunus trituberculatus]
MEQPATSFFLLPPSFHVNALHDGIAPFTRLSNRDKGSHKRRDTYPDLVYLVFFLAVSQENIDDDDDNDDDDDDDDNDEDDDDDDDEDSYNKNKNNKAEGSRAPSREADISRQPVSYKEPDIHIHHFPYYLTSQLRAPHLRRPRGRE